MRRNLPLLALLALALVTQGCFGCLAPVRYGALYVEHREAFNACATAAAQAGKLDEIKDMLGAGRDLSIGEKLAIAQQLDEWGIADECEQAREVMAEEMARELEGLPGIPEENDDLPK